MTQLATEKQIDYIIRLCGGRDDHDAYQAIANVTGMSVSAARRRASKQDASRTIDALKK